MDKHREKGSTWLNGVQDDYLLNSYKLPILTFVFKIVWKMKVMIMPIQLQQIYVD